MGRYSRIHVDPATGEVFAREPQRRVAARPGERNDDWRETFRSGAEIKGGPDPVYTDTRENPLAMPKNRTKPPVHTVLMECESSERANALARSLVFAYSLDAEVGEDETSLRVSGVLAPLALMREVSRWVVSSEVEDLTARQMLDHEGELSPLERTARTAIAGASAGEPMLLPGTKVAVVADFPEMAYRYQPHAQEIVTVVEAGQKDGTILCESERWGLFYAEPDEVDHVTEIEDGVLFGASDYRGRWPR